MAIDFNKQLVFDPKIDIVGNEVPLAAMEKTGAVLQDRYDKSYENETKTQALMKKALQDVAEEDKPAAQAAFDLYEKRLADRSVSGDYQNMRWQTLQDAQEFGNIYTGLSNKAKLIAAEKQKIAESKDYISDESRNLALKQFQKKLKSAQFDEKNRFVTDLNVNAFKEAADVNVAEKWLTVAPSIRTKTSRGQDATFKLKDINGQKVVVKETQTGELERVTPKEIARELKAWGKGDKDITAMIERDMDRMDIEDPKERQKMFDVLYEQETNDVANSLGNMFEVSKDTRKTDFTPYFGADGSGSGGNSKKPIMGIPVNTLANAYGNIEGNLRENLVKGLTGEKGSLNAIMNFVNSKVANLPEDKQPKNYKEFKQVLNEVKNLTPEQQVALAPTFESVFKPGVTIAAASASVNLLKDPKLRSIQDKLLKNVGTYFSFDTEAENEFDNYVKENQAFQNINLLTPSYQDAESINKMQTWMSKSLAGNDFKSFKGKIDPKADYSLSKVSDRPVGNGTGIVIEFKNNKDNSTILVEPKDERMLYALESNFPGIVAANMFKNTSDFNAGEIRPVSEIFKENNPSGKQENLFPKGYPDILKTSKVFYKDGMFMLLDSKGNPLQNQDGQPITSTSYLDLIQ